jgi:subtilisin family serine protease
MAIRVQRLRFRRPRRHPTLLILTAIAAAFVILCGRPSVAAPRYVPGEILLKFRENLPKQQARSLRSELGVVRSRRLDSIGAEHLTVSVSNVEPLVARYKDDPRLVFIEPNYIYSFDAIPGDPEFGAQWNLHNTGQTGGTPGADVRAPEAWDITTGSAAVVVAILDTGIDFDHPDLAPNIFINSNEIAGNGVDDDGNGYADDVRGWDFVNADPDPTDDHGHGTQVAGVIGAVSDTAGIAGIAWSVRLLPVKIGDASGTTSTNLAILGMDYAIAMGARILNNSWGDGLSSEALRMAIERARDAGAIFVASAGNAGADNDWSPNFPSSFDVSNIIAVGSSTDDDELWMLSNYGATSVDLAAPGEAIRTTLTGRRYVTNSGTSLAAPHVSGVLALLWSRFPGLPAARAKEQILATVEPLPALAGRVVTGGRLDAAAALQLPDTSPPSAVTDLSAQVIEGTRIELRWTATGDDGFAGTALSYVVRYSTEPLDDGNFARGTPAAGAPAPSPSGLPEVMSAVLPAFATHYYLALRVSDECGNVSPVSNLAEATTSAPPDVDGLPAAVAETLCTGETGRSRITIRNSGLAALRFGFSMERSPLQAAPTGSARRAGVAPEDAGWLSLLLLYTGFPGSSLGPIQAALSALPDIERVETFNGYMAVPELWQLIPYDCVIVASEGGFRSSEDLGNVLADYVDEGGGLVLTLESFVHPPVAGRIAGFSPVGFSALHGSSSSLGRLDPAHPILDGVGALESSDLADIFQAPGAYVAARWLDGEPLVLTKGSGVVALNLRVSGDDSWAGDAPRLLGNAALWAHRPAAWLTASPETGDIAAAGSAEIRIGFDARGQTPGRHQTTLVVSTNDPDESAVRIPVTLEIIAAPDIELEETALDFGLVTVGESRARDLVVRNVGAIPLEVTGATSSIPDFIISPSHLTVAPDSDRSVRITFRPASAAPIAATLLITSDDPDEGELSVALTGIGGAPPVLLVAPDSLAPRVHPGSVCSDTLTISNPGGAALDWAVHVGSSSTPPDLTGRQIVWDAAHGQLNLFEPPSTVLSDLVERGARVETNAVPLTPGALAGVTVFWLGDHNLGWELTEMEALAAWVAEGGAVIFEGDDEFSREGYNYMLGLMNAGIEYRWGSPGGGAATGIIAHPATEGISSISLPSQQARLTRITSPASALVVSARDEVVAAWTFVGEGRIVALSDQIFANDALDTDDNRRFAARVFDWLVSPRWLRCAPADGHIAAGGETILRMSCDATQLAAGVYSARLFLTRGNPAVWGVVAPVNLQVEIGPQLVASANSLTFPAVQIGSEDSLFFTVRNDGSRALEVTGITASSTDFSASPRAFTLAPQDSMRVAAVFRPQRNGEIEATLRFAGNDWDGMPDLRLSGTGVPATAPEFFALRQNAPNPFGPSTTIRFDLPVASFVNLAVYDPAGRRVATLIGAAKPAGEHEAVWFGRDENGRRVASGVYVCRIEAAGFTATRRLVLLR